MSSWTPSPGLPALSLVVFSPLFLEMGEEERGLAGIGSRGMGGLRGPEPAACALIVPSPTITTVLPSLHGPGDSVPQKVLGTNKVELPGDQVAQVSG